MRSITALLAVLAAASILSGQEPRAILRPPAQLPNAPPDGSAAPDGYAPIPAWLGQTHAPRPARAEPYSVDTVAAGLSGGFSFHFLPDGRIIVGERPGRIRLVGKDGKPSAPLGGLPEIWARGPQGLFEVLPDRDFAKSRTLYLTYTALPAGTNASNPPRLAGVLMVAQARLSDDSTRLENVKTLLAAEGIGGRAVQAADGSEAYTRSGSLQLNANGILQTQAGQTVLGEGGPISVPPHTSLMIAADGTISIVPVGQGPETTSQVGRIKLVNPPAESLVRGEDGLFRVNDGTDAPADANVRVASGVLETSNVNVADAMVNMIELSRHFDLQVKAMRTAEENAAASAQLLKA